MKIHVAWIIIQTRKMLNHDLMTRVIDIMQLDGDRKWKTGQNILWFALDGSMEFQRTFMNKNNQWAVG